MLINLPKRSLSIELRSFFETLGQEDLCCTKGAFSLQRAKLKPMIFKVWNDFLVKNFYRFYGDNVKRWEGFKLLAVDGSNFSVVNKPKVVAYFGSADNQFGGVPMARAMQIHDVLKSTNLPDAVRELFLRNNSIRCQSNYSHEKRNLHFSKLNSLICSLRTIRLHWAHSTIQEQATNLI